MLQKPVFHYCIRNSPPLIPIPSQTNSVHTLSSHILNIQSILSTHLRRVLKEISFHEVSLLKPCTHVLFPPCVPNTPRPLRLVFPWFRYPSRQIAGDKSLPKISQCPRPCVTFRNMLVISQLSTRGAMHDKVILRSVRVITVTV